MISPPHDPLADPLPGYGAIVERLEAARWRAAPRFPLEGQVRIQTFQGGHDAPCRRFENEAGRGLALVGLESVRLPGRDELFPRFLNLPLECRLAIELTRAAAATDWLLLLTAGRLELIRLPEESCRQWAGGGESFRRELAPMLALLGRGGEEWHGARQPSQPEAESLTGWLRHWSLQLGAALVEPPVTAERILWQWVLMLQRARHGGGSAGAREWGLRLGGAAGHPTIVYDAPSATEDLTRQLTNFEDHFESTLLAVQLDELPARLEALDETTLLDRLRAEMLMHTQNRFEPETVAWLFTSLEREQEGWRREVRGVEPIRRRLQLDGWLVERPLLCDIGHFGLTAALRDLEALALFLHETRELTGAADAVQPDLFRGAPRGVNRRGELFDPLNYLFSEALRVVGVPPSQRGGVALTLLLKALSVAARLDWPATRVDSLDRIFGE